ncbi:TolC family protein [Dechloromonas sp. H13]|uniref:TolC family protein n=1 Tax=Dechloromonas sp. H13 TaxID=2570193 RepID=UPI0012926FB8|nr:TolC family protein [Dechloromonas sp. H13]
MRHLLIALLLLPVAVLAQTPQRLSLAEAEALWQEHNRELQLARTAVSGAEADLVAAGQIPNPQVSLNITQISPSTGYGSGPWKDKKMDNVLRLDQLVERGGKRDLRVKGADALLDASRRDLDDTGRQQLLNLQQTYYDLRLAQDKRRLAGESAATYDRGLETGRIRLKAGDISQVELSRLQIDKSRADNDARQAQSELEQAQVALAYLIGREREAALLVADDAWPPLASQQRQRGDLDQRPDVAAARLRVAAAEAARDLAKAQKTRDVTLGVQYEHNMQSEPTDSFGFGVSVPLFIWHEYEGEIGRAEADLTAARLLYDRTLAQAVGSADQAGSALRSAEERLRRLETGLLADAERVAQAAELAYSRGAMNLMDLLDARRTLRQVQVEAATARADYAKALAAWRLQADYGKTR